MKDYMKPLSRENPDHFILHVGTNDLNTEIFPELMAKSIADLAKTLSVSNIIVSTDHRSLKKYQNKSHESRLGYTLIRKNQRYLMMSFLKKYLMLLTGIILTKI